MENHPAQQQIRFKAKTRKHTTRMSRSVTAGGIEKTVSSKFNQKMTGIWKAEVGDICYKTHS